MLLRVRNLRLGWKDDRWITFSNLRNTRVPCFEDTMGKVKYPLNFCVNNGLIEKKHSFVRYCIAQEMMPYLFGTKDR